MRKTLVIALAALAGCWTVAALAPRARAAVTKEQLNKVVAQLQANGEMWAEDENVPDNDKPNLSALKFDKASAPVVLAALRGMKRDVAGLYATARLLEALTTADNETLDAIMPEVNSILVRTKGYYRPFPPMSKAQSDALSMPDNIGRMNTEAIMARMAQLETLRNAKKKRDMLVAKGNEAAWDTEQAGWKIVAKAGDAAEDTKAVLSMALAERAEDYMYSVIIDAYQAMIPKMDPARAARLYSAVRPHALRLRLQAKKNYVKKGECILHYDTTSQTATAPEVAGIKFVQFANRLALAAKDPRLQQIPMPNQKK